MDRIAVITTINGIFTTFLDIYLEAKVKSSARIVFLHSLLLIF